MLNNLTSVKQLSNVKQMNKKYVTLSHKYQLVIPSYARKVMGGNNIKGQHFSVKKVTKNEIVFKKEPILDDYFGAFDNSFPENITAALRKMRDEDWE